MRVFFFQITQHAMSKMSSLITLPEFLAQTTTAPGGASPQGGGMSTQFIFMALLFGAMYFLMIAPQRKKQKAHEAMLKSLESGDEVVTTGGIFGVITNVKEDRFVVRIADNTKIEVGKAFVQTVVKKTGAEKK
jgi:preprotein translocase subunit YajC